MPSRDNVASIDGYCIYRKPPHDFLGVGCMVKLNSVAPAAESESKPLSSSSDQPMPNLKSGAKTSKKVSKYRASEEEQRQFAKLYSDDLVITMTPSKVNSSEEED